MKKLLILGASVDQVLLIKAAKEHGLYVVCCDYTNDNPGLPFVDKHYQVDYMDRDAVLEIGMNEKVDGVFSNSERAMFNVAYVSERMGLVGNSVKSVETIVEKNVFRDLLEKEGLYCPDHFWAKDYDELFSRLQKLQFPIIIKPCASTASKGIQVISEFDRNMITQAFDECLKFSWNKMVEVEEFVQMPSSSSIEGEIFVYGDDIWFNGLFDVHRSRYYSMIPMAYSCPFRIEEEKMNVIKNVVRKIVKGAGLVFGEFNIEMYFTKNGDLFVIELNPRQGGRYLPQMVQEHNGINYYKLLVSLAVGDEKYYEYVKSSSFIPQENCVSKYMVFGHKEGILEGVYFSPEIKPFVKCEQPLKNKGDIVKDTRNGTHAIGIVDLLFDNYQQQRYFMENIEDFIYPIIS